MSEARNAAIVSAYRSGLLQREVAERFELSQSHVSRIIRDAGIVPVRRGHMNCTPDVRARLSAALKRRWQSGDPRLGGKTILADRPDERRIYLKVRRILGAAAARSEWVEMAGLHGAAAESHAVNGCPLSHGGPDASA